MVESFLAKKRHLVLTTQICHYRWVGSDPCEVFATVNPTLHIEMKGTVRAMSSTSSSLNKVNIGQVGQLVNAINADKKNGE